MRPDWKTCRIQDDRYLTHCPTLPVTSARDRDGMPIFLLGLAVQTDVNRADPDIEIQNLDPQSIEDTTDTWAGRWILISRSELTLDATGLLGAFFRSEGHDQTWISSSPSILADLPDRPVCSADVRRLRHGLGIEWYAPPRSGFVGVRRLLASQRLHLVSGAITPRRLMPTRTAPPDYPEILDKLESILITGISNVGNKHDSLWIPLTAGLDSRLLLAATIAAGKYGRTITLDYKGMARGDLELPPKLSACVGLPHTLVDRGDFSVRLAEEYDEHTGRHYPETDREFYARGQFDWAGKNDVVLRGGCFHVARCYYWHLFGKNELPDKYAFARAFVEDSDSSGVAGLCEWFEWAIVNPQAGIDWRDRLYWEQRIGGWLSSCEQALDLCDFEVLNPINSAEALALLVSIPLEIRCTGAHHEDLIERMAPELLRFPFNPSDPLYRRWISWSTKIGSRLLDPRYAARLIKRRIAKFDRS